MVIVDRKHGCYHIMSCHDMLLKNLPIVPDCVLHIQLNCF